MSQFKTSDYIATFSGRQIDLGDVKPGDIDIIDIAVGLGQQCRYTGQVWPFYSIAEHSVLVARHMPAGATRHQRLQALLHDAPEYLLNDLTRPTKRRVSGYEQLEDHVMYAVDRAYSLNYEAQDWANIKHIDNLITIPERRKFIPRLPTEAYGRGVNEAEIPDVKFWCFEPREAVTFFLAEYLELSDSSLDPTQQGLLDMILGRQP